MRVGQRKNRVFTPIFQAFDDKSCEEKQHTISEAINNLNENQISAAIVEQTLWNALLIFMFQACPISSIGCITYSSGETAQASKTTSNFALNVYFLALEEKYCKLSMDLNFPETCPEYATNSTLCRKSLEYLTFHVLTRRTHTLDDGQGNFEKSLKLPIEQIVFPDDKRGMLFLNTDNFD